MKKSNQFIQQQPQIKEYNILRWFETITLIRETETTTWQKSPSVKSEDTSKDESIS